MRNRRAARRTSLLQVWAFLLFLVSPAMPCAAQTSSSRLEGIVEDASGAIIPGAGVIALHTRTQLAVKTLTNETGIFVFPALPPGDYTVSAEAQGFKREVHTAVILNVSATVREVFRLEVGTTAETVTVEAGPQRINTSDGQVANIITMRDIDVLPQLVRRPMILAAFQPGVQIYFVQGSAEFSRVNGTRQGSNNSTLDGIDINNAAYPRLGFSMTFNNTDSVAEFRIVTSGGKAEYGRSAGAQVELITRSGGNRWSGNAFDYLRNTVLEANNFFNNSVPKTPTSNPPARPKYIQNIFGGSLGGPILRDRLFVFGNYQGRRTRQEIIRNRTVLTPDAKKGIFRWTTPGSGILQSFDIIAADPRKLGIDKEVAKNLALLPDPNNYDVGDRLNTAGFRFNNPYNYTEDQFTIRGDFNLTSKNRIFYRHSWARVTTTDIVNSRDSTFPGQPSGSQRGHPWGMAVGSDWTINPRLVNEFRYGHQSFGDQYSVPREKRPLILSNLFTDPLQTGFPSEENDPVDEFTDNITFIKGSHTFKAGLNLRFLTQDLSSYAGAWANIRVARASGAAPPGTIGPNGGATISSTDRAAFENLYNDLLGRMSQTAVTYYSDLEKFQPAGTPRVRHFVYREQGDFFQDDWRIRPNLVLNLGLRWEFYGAPFERNGYQGVIDQAERVTSWANISNLALKRSSKWYNNDWNNFAPRIGFSWSPGRSARTSIRGGWGIYYDRTVSAVTANVDTYTPGFAESGFSFPNSAAGSDARVSDGVPIAPVPAAPVLRQPTNRVNFLAMSQPDLRTGYVNHINLSIQRELIRNTVLDVAYVGTRGIKLNMTRNINQPRVKEGFLSDFQELQAFRAGGTPVPADNALVRMFGSVSAAIAGVGGASTVDQGLVGTAANNVDRFYYSKYAAAGISDYYLRNYPQFFMLVSLGSDGRSCYDSLQASLRRQTGALKMAINYTFSKIIDNVSLEGGYTPPIDSYVLSLNRARGDVDLPHSANWSVIYSLPIGSNHWLGRNFPGWADKAFGGWDIGMLGIWQSGTVFTVSSGRSTYNPDLNSWADYSGDRDIGSVSRQSDGVYYLTAEQKAAFTYPAAGEIGTSGRNTFRGPRFFNIDLSLVKRFRIAENHAISFRAEAYNALNNTNFGGLGTNIAVPASFGKFSSTVNPARIMQMALRYDF